MKRSILVAVAVSAFLVVGCKKEADKAADTGAGMMDKAKDTGAGMMDKAKDTGAGMMDKAKDTGAGMMDKAKDAGAGMMDKAKDAGAGMMDAAKKEADDLLAKAQAAVGDKKWDEATALIGKLDAIKDKIPAEYASKIDDLKALIEKGKKAMEMIPGAK